MSKSPTTTTQEYRPLQFPITKGQFTYKLLKRSGQACMVSQINRATKAQASIEVWVLQHKAETKFPDGRVIPAREAMPSDEQWGIAGWTFMDPKRAQQDFDGLVG